MRLRTFTAPDMPSALKMVREELGENAIILSTESGQGRKNIKVTAAIDPADGEDHVFTKGAPVAYDTAAAGQLRFELQNIFRFHNLPELFSAKILQKATDNELAAILTLHRASPGGGERHLLRLGAERLAKSYFRFDPLPLDSSSLRLMLVGPPGVGKTLTIARLAAQIAMQKHTLAVITTDNKRAGGVEQLQAFTDILELELKVAPTRNELRRILEKIPATTRVLIDTAGCNPYAEAEMDELKNCAVPENAEPVLVLPAGGDSLEMIDIAEAFMALPVKRLLVTRADTARRFGGVLAAAAAHKLAFSNVSMSSSIVEPLQPMDSGLLAQLLLQYK